MNTAKKLALMYNTTKLTKDISLNDIVKCSKTDIIFDTSDFRICESCCSHTVTYIGKETDEKVIKLWCLAIAVANDLCRSRIYCHIDEDEMLFESDDELLDTAWKLASEKCLKYDRFGDAIRKLGYLPQVRYVKLD